MEHLKWKLFLILEQIKLIYRALKMSHENLLRSSDKNYGRGVKNTTK